MCGRYHVSNSPAVQGLLNSLGMGESITPRRNIAPGAYGQFVIERDGQRALLDGMFSLLVEPKPAGVGYRPSPKFSTFNARSDRLTESRLWRGRFARQRAIVPADGFHEWAGKQCYDIIQEGRALALGALYELWEFDGVLVPAFSIITVPPHPRFAHIHPKSLPLLLEPKDHEVWLDPAFGQVEAFAGLMRPHLSRALVATPIGSPMTLQASGAPEIIAAD